MTIQTEKFDWYTKLLTENDNIYVSDEDLIFKIFNKDSGCEFSLRFLGNQKVNYKIILIIKSPNNDFLLADYLVEISSISKNINKLFDQNIPIIVCSKVLSSDIKKARYSYFSIKSGNFIVVDGDGLAKEVFTKLNAEFTENIGEVKEINISMNDDFQLFTRHKLSKFMVANDIDAVIFEKKFLNSEEKIVFIELKRIDTKFNSLENWQPYIDDFSNYLALNNIVKLVENGKMRVIVYTIEEKDLVAVHYLSSIQKDGNDNKIISGLRIVCDLKSSYQIPIGVKYESK